MSLFVEREEARMQLAWSASPEGHWYRLDSLNLQDPQFVELEGVYVIWHGGSRAATVCVGQGFIGERLLGHRSDPQVTRYAPLGLFVTWAAVERSDRSDVAAYLTQALEPKVGARFPHWNPIRVNLPW